MEHRSKYNARPAYLDGYRFDSHAEAERYQELVLLQKCGDIHGLEVHPRFEIFPAFNTKEGHIRAIFYEADFQYKSGGETIVEDVKGVKTDVFRLKRKMFEYKYPEIEFRIIEA